MIFGLVLVMYFLHSVPCPSFGNGNVYSMPLYIESILSALRFFYFICTGDFVEKIALCLKKRVELLGNVDTVKEYGEF